MCHPYQSVRTTMIALSIKRIGHRARHAAYVNAYWSVCQKVVHDLDVDRIGLKFIAYYKSNNNNIDNDYR